MHQKHFWLFEKKIPVAIIQEVLSLGRYLSALIWLHRVLVKLHIAQNTLNAANGRVEMDCVHETICFVLAVLDLYHFCEGIESA